jgi:linoleoyl-CoA desaturase
MNQISPRPRFNTKRDPFFEELLVRVKADVLTQGEGRAGIRTFLKGLFWAALSCTAYVTVLSQRLSATHSFFIALIFGLSVFFLVVNLSHDAAHGSLFRSRRANRIAHFLLFNLMGVDSSFWGSRHVHEHHTFPNVQGHDIDIDEITMLRLSPHNKWRSFHAWQAFYAPLIYLIATLHAIVLQDWLHLKSRLEIQESKVERRRTLALFMAAKFYYLSIWVLLPICLTSYSGLQIGLTYLAVSAVVAFGFVPIVATHLASPCEFPLPDDQNRLPYSFARHQLACSLDWYPKSKIAAFFYGGLNSHAAHHLFPRVSHEHYAQIAVIIEEVARSYGVPYNCASFWGALQAHFNHLYELGRSKERLTSVSYRAFRQT